MRETHEGPKNQIFFSTPTDTATLIAAMPSPNALFALLVVGGGRGVVFFDHAEFNTSWDDAWSHHDWHEHSARFVVNSTHRALQTATDARFYHASAPFVRPFDASRLVVQFRARHPQKLDCGGGYLKLIDSKAHTDAVQRDSTPYRLMFGPDVCGNKNQTHVMLAHNASYHELEPPMPCATDQAAHVYTLHIDSESGTYAVHIDDDRKRSGALRDDWKILPPRVVPDERYEKPSDWVDERLVDDPEDVKPIGWDDEAQIVDPAAEKPHDWNDDDDGEWEAPLIDNPGFNGTWRPRRVVNPAFVGEWSPPMLSNPDYFDDPSIGDMRGVDTLAMEIWQVRAGSLFDHFLITDDVELARARARALLVQTSGHDKDEV